jgi:hypothetical protein
MRELYISYLEDDLGSLKKGLGGSACTLLRRILFIKSKRVRKLSIQNRPPKPFCLTMSLKRRVREARKKPTFVHQCLYMTFRTGRIYCTILQRGLMCDVYLVKRSLKKPSTVK